MAGGKVSAGCAGVGPGGAELLPADVDACAASSLWMSRAWLAHCCAADGRAQGLAAAGAAAGAGAGVDAEAAAPGAGAASPKGTAWGSGLEAQVWSKFLWASWTSSKVRWASSVFCSAWSPNTKLGCWKLNPASWSSFAAALLFRKISLNRELEVFTFRFFSELGSFSKFNRTIARVLSDLAASALLLLSATSFCKQPFVASKKSRTERGWPAGAGDAGPDGLEHLVANAGALATACSDLLLVPSDPAPWIIAARAWMVEAESSIVCGLELFCVTTVCRAFCISANIFWCCSCVVCKVLAHISTLFLASSLCFLSKARSSSRDAFPSA
mmetsp:Transcript_131829/g.312500  ORF Transcript_131829/g.312500 Transcript_131829/m.312500 type:complete len:328 (-) Transcript_131829:375-1358(-)